MTQKIKLVECSEINLSNTEKRTKRKNEYIPGLAAFYFTPAFSWFIEDAKRLYYNQMSKDNNTIFYEDCIEGLKRLSSESIDLIIADPPFGLDFNGKESIYNRDSTLVLEDYNDVRKSEYLEFTQKWTKELIRLMKETSSVFIFSGWTNLTDVLIALRESKLYLINHLIWQYQFGVYTKRKFVTSHYHLLWLVKDPDKYFFNKIEHYPSDVWDIPRTYKRGEKKNGTKLPQKLIEKCIHFCSKPGDVVLDPFMGNGTTAICAKGNFRHFIGFEINVKMKPIIDNALAKIETGEFYIPYKEVPLDIEHLKRKYPKAYKEYARREGLKV